MCFGPSPLDSALVHNLHQGSAIGGPRARCGPQAKISGPWDLLNQKKIYIFFLIFKKSDCQSQKCSLFWNVIFQNRRISINLNAIFIWIRVKKHARCSVNAQHAKTNEVSGQRWFWNSKLVPKTQAVIQTTDTVKSKIRACYLGLYITVVAPKKKNNNTVKSEQIRAKKERSKKAESTRPWTGVLGPWNDRADVLLLYAWIMPSLQRDSFKKYSSDFSYLVWKVASPAGYYFLDIWWNRRHFNPQAVLEILVSQSIPLVRFYCIHSWEWRLTHVGGREHGQNVKCDFLEVAVFLGAK